MALFGRKKKNKVLVIGLDGVPVWLLQHLMDVGVMPKFKTLCEEGILQSMKASLPEISAVSWADFMTGTQSGEHGIYGFTDFKDRSYEITFPNFTDLKARTLWDRLGDMGKRSVVVNQPSTYPARPIPGCLISGFVAINIKKAVHPLPLLRKVMDFGYSIDITTMACRRDHDLCLSELTETLKRRKMVVDWLWMDQDWDLLEVVVTGTDRLQHFVWSCIEDSKHPLHPRAMEYYAAIDSLIEEWVDRFLGDPGGDLSRVFLLSDHGFCGIEQEVRLNTWLMQEGLLSFLTDEPQELSQMDPKSVAFFLDPGRLYLNRKRRFEQGWIEDEDAESILVEIIDKLTSLKYNGNHVIRYTFKDQEIYKGPHLNQAPDLVLLSHKGYDLKGTVKERELFGRSDLEGMHTWDEAFFWSMRPKENDLRISSLSDFIVDALA